MSDNAEEGIARAHTKAAQETGASGLKEIHGSGIAYLNDRILVFVLAISLIGLAVLWATSESAMVVYGSLAVVIGIALLTGVAWIRRIERTRQQRTQQAQNWRGDKTD